MCCFSTTHQLCVSFLPPRPHDTHSLFDWQLTLMVHTSPPICLSTFHSSEEAFRFFVFSEQERLISQFVQTFSFWHPECFPTNAFWSRLLGYRTCSTCRAAVQDSRMCGGNFTGCSHAWRIALQPFCFLCRSVVHVCLCVYPRLCLSALAHIQNGKGENNWMTDNITDHKNMLVKKKKENSNWLSKI